LVRRHPAGQIRKLARSLDRFGFVLPIIVDKELRIVAGAALKAAAVRLELTEVPVVIIDDLSAAEVRLLRLALNRISEDATWDEGALQLELQSLISLDDSLDLTLSGFESAQIDQVLRLGDDAGDADDETLPGPGVAIEERCQQGDLWQLGPHRLFCGDALAASSYRQLLGDEPVRLLLSDPPYNLPIDGFVGGKGRAQHGDFAMASGEMDGAAFSGFLQSFLECAAGRLVDGGLGYVFMDWRHLGEVLAATRAAKLALLNLCVWAKTNAGMGSFYRSQHELVLVLKKGAGPHINNVALGRHGRNRSNLWTYAGVNSFGPNRDQFLALHPTVKPVALLKDVILDASDRSDWILDPFAGSGSTLIAAERTGRRCAAIELDPHYCDVILTRYETASGKSAARIAREQPTSEIAAQKGAAS
jgi:DNA modification methylase